MRLLNSIAVACIFCSAFLNSGHAQEVADKKPTKVIESFHVKTDVRFRFATTQMVSVVRNTADHAQEIDFSVALPKEAFITSFFMFIDGKIYQGEVKEKEKAKRQYQKAVERGESAGLIRQKPRHANIFEVSVNVAKGSAVNFTLTYQQVLKRKLGVYDLEIHVDPGMPVEDFSIKVDIMENTNIKFVRTPALRNDSLLTNEVAPPNDITIIELPTPKTALVLYKPSLDEQGEEGISARFIVQYDVEHGKKGEILVANGYFVHFFAPDLPAMPKDIVFTLDVSGSMSGAKISQLKKAMTVILKDLKPEDKLNILTFNEEISWWQTTLLPASPENIHSAISFVKNLNAGGMTNINDALLRSLYVLDKEKDTKRAPLIFFLTDGVPTAGETQSSEITKNVLRRNEAAFSIISLAFGSGADYNMLKTMSAQNSGFARKIYEASDSSLQVSSLYKEVSAVVLRNVTFTYLPGTAGQPVPEPIFVPIIYTGVEVPTVCVFPLDDFPDPSEIRLRVSGQDANGPIEIDLDSNDVEVIGADGATEKDFTGIIEKMWAFLTIKKLLKEKEKEANNEDKLKELNGKILEMSLKYMFVTPLTSMVVTKPQAEDQPEESVLEDADDINAGAGNRNGFPRRMAKVSGGSHHMNGFPGRQYFSGIVSGKRRGPASRRRQYSRGNPSHQFDPHVPTHTVQSFVRQSTQSVLTTPSPVTFRRTKKPKTRKKKKSKKQIRILQSLILEKPTFSVCVEPKRTRDGLYLLLSDKANDMVTVKLRTTCLKNCRLVVPQSLYLTVNAMSTVLYFNSTSSNAWNVTRDGMSTVTIQRSSILMTYKNTELEVSKTRKGRKEFYTVKVVQKSAAHLEGLIDVIAKIPDRKLKKLSRRRPRKGCKKSGIKLAFLAKPNLMQTSSLN